MAGRNLVRLPSGSVVYAKDDELELLAALDLEGEHFTIGALADSLGMRPGRRAYLEAKWAARGWWDYKITGQLTPLGLVVLAASQAPVNRRDREEK